MAASSICVDCSKQHGMNIRMHNFFGHQQCWVSPSNGLQPFVNGFLHRVRQKCVCLGVCWLQMVWMWDQSSAIPVRRKPQTMNISM